MPTEGAEEGSAEAAALPEETAAEEVGAQTDTTLEADEELEIGFAEDEAEEAALDGIDVEPLPPGSNAEELHRVATSLDTAGRTVCLRALLSPQQLRQLDELASDFCVRIDPAQFPVPPFINCPFPSHIYNELLQTVRAAPSSSGEMRKWRDSVRRHAVLHGRLKKPGSKPIAAREVAINEAAAAICRRIPTLLFYRRELSNYAKQVSLFSFLKSFFHFRCFEIIFKNGLAILLNAIMYCIVRERVIVRVARDQLEDPLQNSGLREGDHH